MDSPVQECNLDTVQCPSSCLSYVSDRVLSKEVPRIRVYVQLARVESFLSRSWTKKYPSMDERAVYQWVHAAFNEWYCDHDWCSPYARHTMCGYTPVLVGVVFKKYFVVEFQPSRYNLLGRCCAILELPIQKWKVVRVGRLGSSVLNCRGGSDKYS